MTEKEPCKNPELCPWKTNPVVGMWAKVDGIEFWGTNCLLHIKCPDPRWTNNKSGKNIRRLTKEQVIEAARNVNVSAISAVDRGESYKVGEPK